MHSRATLKLYPFRSATVVAESQSYHRKQRELSMGCTAEFHCHEMWSKNVALNIWLQEGLASFLCDY